MAHRRIRRFARLLLLAACLLGAPGETGAARDALARSENDLLNLSLVAYENEFYEISLDYLAQFSDDYPASRRTDYALLLEGLNLRRLGRFDEAIRVLSRLTGEHATSAHFHHACYLLGEARLQAGNHEAAEKDFQSALAGPLTDDLASAAYQGLLSAQAGNRKFFEALVTLRAWTGRFPARAGDPANAAIVLAAAEGYLAEALRNRELHKVFTVGRLVLDESPEHPLLEKIRYYLATAYFQSENFALARELYRPLAAAADPEIAALAAFRLGDILAREKNPDEAAACYRRAALAPDRQVQAAAEYQLGVLARRKRDYAGAVLHFQAAADKSRDAVLAETAFFDLASTVFLSGDYERSLELYRDFQRRFPRGARFTDAAIQASFSLYNLKRYQEARAGFSAFIRDHPASPMAGQAHYGLGLTLLALGESEAAFDLWGGFLRGQASLAGHAPIVLFYARHLLEKNQPDLALVYLAKVSGNPAEEDSSRVEAFLLLGLAWLQKNDLPRAISSFQAGLGLEAPASLAETLAKNLADAFVAAGRFEQALPLFEDLRSRLSPRRGEVLFGLATCLHQLGRTEEAVRAYLEALVNLPDGSPLAGDARDALARLRKQQP